jgi:hypothetical protein
MFKHLSGAIATLAFSALAGAPLISLAQDVPSYAQPPAPAAPADVQIRGRILSFDGAYALSVHDEHGYTDTVQLHEGTIINPTGLTLAPGMIVSVLGYNQGSYFSANEVDTPYTYDDGTPYYLGHPWNYYYGPSYGISFFFGNTGWWHGGYFQGPYHYYNGYGARVYNSVNVQNVYRQNAPGGQFHGRSYVAPASAGGYRAHATSSHGGHGR